MKKHIGVLNILIIYVMLAISLTSCVGKDSYPAFSDGLFVKISYTPVNVNEDETTFTVNVEILQDGTMYIYADNFVKWYGENEPDRMKLKLSDEEVEDVKKSIIREGLFDMHNDVGNKDITEGIRKEIIIYTAEGEYSIYGINPSNRSFNKVYEQIYGLRREELVTYVDKINEIQETGSRNDVGIYLTNQSGNKIFLKEDIENIYSEEYYPEGEEEPKTRIVFVLNDEAQAILDDAGAYTDKKKQISYKMYNDNKYIFDVIVNESDDGCFLFADVLYDEKELEDVIKELNEGLE